MSIGATRVYTVSMASGATLTTSINLNRAYDVMYLQVPSMISNSNMMIQAAASLAAVYNRVVTIQANTSTIGHNTFIIGSGATGHCIQLPAGLQFLKIETTASCDSGETFTLICHDV